MKKISPVILVVGLLLTIASFVLFIARPVFIHDMSNKLYDVFLRNTSSPEQSGAVVIVDLDDESLSKYGQ